MGFRRLTLAFAAVRQMGLQPLALYARYQIGLRSGFYRWATPAAKSQSPADGSPVAERAALPVASGQQSVIENFLTLPSRPALAAALGDRTPDLLAEADEIVDGKVRLFGAEAVPLILTLPGPLRHWTEVKQRGGGSNELAAKPPGSEDIKFIWEPGRFGWAYILARAYRLCGDERYAQAFWHWTETFLNANPANLGPHWSSAQEVALRLIALSFAAQVFRGSVHTTSDRTTRLARAVAEHAARIPPTLVYARSQNNNHLLTEAAGLITAGVFLAGHPAAAGWRALGWRWFERGIASQIAQDGAYTQNSANYHRLVLQIAMWVARIGQLHGQVFSVLSTQRLEAAARWLLSLVDAQTGQVPNLGPNDGAHIFPLAACPFADYRPVLQSACLAFLGERPFPGGPWDEMELWLIDKGKGIGERGVEHPADSSPLIPYPLSPTLLAATPHILRSPSGQSWAYFRNARHTTRPGHADQLHLDLWWRGENIAQDAGSYLYNTPPPWDNALASTFVHNTIAVDGREQMWRAGRFLWLDWAHGQALSGQPGERGSWVRLVAQHDGYRRLGILHQRQVSVSAPDRWVIEDRLVYLKPSTRNREHTVRLHWLLPDWPWEIGEKGEARVAIRVKAPTGWLLLQMGINIPPTEPALESSFSSLALQVVRAGELLHGLGQVSPTWGWVSPTYGQKKPALSFALIAQSLLPVSLISEWIFPGASSDKNHGDHWSR